MTRTPLSIRGPLAIAVLVIGGTAACGSVTAAQTAGNDSPTLSGSSRAAVATARPSTHIASARPSPAWCLNIGHSPGPQSVQGPPTQPLRDDGVTLIPAAGQQAMHSCDATVLPGTIKRLCAVFWRAYQKHHGPPVLIPALAACAGRSAPKSAPAGTGPSPVPLRTAG